MLKRLLAGTLSGFFLLCMSAIVLADPPMGGMKEGMGYGMGMMGMGMDHSGAMHGMDYDLLDLSSNQREKIAAIRMSSRENYRKIGDDIATKYRELGDLKKAPNADMVAIGKKIDEIAVLYNQLTSAMVEDHEKILGVLTPGQKKQLPYLKSMLLRHFYGLELTDSQKADIVGLEEQARPKIMDLSDKILQQERTYHANLYSANFNRDATLKDGLEVTKTYSALEKLKAELFVKAYKLLTAEQRTKLESLMEHKMKGPMMERNENERMERK